MPLRRAVSFEPVLQPDADYVHFPTFDVADQSKVVWGRISAGALRRRALREKVKTGHGKPELFERYRTVAESLASELYDKGSFRVWPDGRITVHIPDVML
jgi:hypothetical protein